jgi:hypothetical protein
MSPNPRTKADRVSYAARTAAFMPVENEWRRSASDGTGPRECNPCAGGGRYTTLIEAPWFHEPFPHSPFTHPALRPFAFVSH